MVTSVAVFAYTPVLGLPAIVWGGIITLLLLLVTAAIPVLNRRGIRTVPIAWHYRLAVIVVILALGHGIAGILIFL